jgi:ribosomal protein S1
VGRELDCLVAEADRTTDKIVLTRRSLLRRLDRQRTGELLAGLSEGQTLKGVVTRLADYGAFVRVLDRIEGLVHVSELAEYRVHLPEEVVIPGDEVMVKVLRIDRRRRRIDLSVNQAVQFVEASPTPGPDVEPRPEPEAGTDVEGSDPEAGTDVEGGPEASTGEGPGADADADADATADAGLAAAEPAVDPADDSTTEDH